MTVKELIEKLSEYDENMEVSIDIPGELCDVIKIDTDGCGKEYIVLS